MENSTPESDVAVKERREFLLTIGAHENTESDKIELNGDVLGKLIEKAKEVKGSIVHNWVQ